MKRKAQKGSLRWFIILVIAFIIASFYFDFDLKEAVEDEKTQSNFNYIKTHVVKFYNKNLSSHVDYLWNDIFIDIFWDSFVKDMKNLNLKEKTSFEKFAPSVEVQE